MVNMELRIDFEQYTTSMLPLPSCHYWELGGSYCEYVIEYWTYGDSCGIVLFGMPPCLFVLGSYMLLEFPVARCIYITVTSHERHGVSNHWQLHCLFNNSFRLIAKKTSKLHIVQCWCLMRAIHCEHFHAMTSWNPHECLIACSTEILELKYFRPNCDSYDLLKSHFWMKAELSWLLQNCHLVQ